MEQLRLEAYHGGDPIPALPTKGHPMYPSHHPRPGPRRNRRVRRAAATLSAATALIGALQLVGFEPAAAADCYDTGGGYCTGGGGGDDYYDPYYDYYDYFDDGSYDDSPAIYVGDLGDVTITADDAPPIDVGDLGDVT